MSSRLNHVGFFFGWYTVAIDLPYFGDYMVFLIKLQLNFKYIWFILKDPTHNPDPFILVLSPWSRFTKLDMSQKPKFPSKITNLLSNTIRLYTSTGSDT